MGPCELMDLTGVDVNYPVSMIIYEGYDHDPRLKTAFPHRGLLEAGKLGRKTGAGNYEYDEKGRMVDPPSPDFLTGAAPAAGVVLVEPSAELNAFAEAIGLPVVAKDDHVSPLLAAPVGEDCSALAARLQLDHRRLVAVDLWCDTHKRVTLMRPPGAGASAMEAVAAGIIASGRAVTAIKDSPGFVAQRIRAVVAALGTEMAQIGVADPEEIDTALKLGLNYPLGPLELAEHLGLDKLLGALRRMQQITGEDRYRPTHWLRRRAELGLSIHASD
jgi:3-hydroxybutyryl-CoA dehydrogenase